MSILKWIFNLLRTISFIIVLFLCLVIAFFVLNPTVLEEMLSGVEHQESASIFGGKEFKEDEDSSIGVFSSDDTEDLNHGIEYDTPGLQPMISFKTDEGEVLLRLSKIVSLESGKPYHTLSTIEGEIENINHRIHSLSRVYQSLERESCFFKMKQAIINCSYIDKVYPKNGVWRVRMENGKRIHLPDEQYYRLMEHLQEQFPNKIISQ